MRRDGSRHAAQHYAPEARITVGTENIESALSSFAYRRMVRRTSPMTIEVSDRTPAASRRLACGPRPLPWTGRTSNPFHGFPRPAHRRPHNDPEPCHWGPGLPKAGTEDGRSGRARPPYAGGPPYAYRPKRRSLRGNRRIRLIFSSCQSPLAPWPDGEWNGNSRAILGTIGENAHSGNPGLYAKWRAGRQNGMRRSCNGPGRQARPDIAAS
jgi:hypothetical protein